MKNSIVGQGREDDFMRLSRKKETVSRCRLWRGTPFKIAKRDANGLVVKDNEGSEGEIRCRDPEEGVGYKIPRRTEWKKTAWRSTEEEGGDRFRQSNGPINQEKKDWAYVEYGHVKEKRPSRESYEDTEATETNNIGKN